MQQGLYNYIIQTIFWNICFWTFQGVRKTSSCDSYLYCLGYWYCWFLQLFIAKIILMGLNKRTRLIWTQVCESFLTQSSGLGWCSYSILHYLLLVLVFLVLVLLGLWYPHHLHFLHCPLHCLPDLDLVFLLQGLSQQSLHRRRLRHYYHWNLADLDLLLQDS